MMVLDQEEAAMPTVDMSSKKKELLTSAMKRTSEWYCFLSSTYILHRVSLKKFQ